jgi:hypothetical protein
MTRGQVGADQRPDQRFRLHVTSGFTHAKSPFPEPQTVLALFNESNRLNSGTVRSETS